MNPAPLCTPPSRLRVLALLAGLAWRRILNRWGAVRSVLGRRQGKAEGVREATPRKRRGSRLLTVLILGLLVLQLVFLVGILGDSQRQAQNFVEKEVGVVSAGRHTGLLEATDTYFHARERYERALEKARREGRDPGAVSLEKPEFSWGGSSRGRTREPRRGICGCWPSRCSSSSSIA